RRGGDQGQDLAGPGVEEHAGAGLLTERLVERALQAPVQGDLERRSRRGLAAGLGVPEGPAEVVHGDELPASPSPQGLVEALLDPRPPHDVASLQRAARALTAELVLAH